MDPDNVQYRIVDCIYQKLKSLSSKNQSFLEIKQPKPNQR